MTPISLLKTPSDKKLNDKKIVARFSSRTTSPFARFNLFRNPFGELTVAERAELAVVDVEKYLAWLEQSSRAVLQVIGPCGHGKSTHLRALQYAWATRYAPADLPAFVYFPEEGHQPALPRSRPLFIDEAQRMGWWRRRQMLRGDGPLVIATHRDLSREFMAAGFQLMTIDLDQPMPTQQLHELLGRRIAASRSVSPGRSVSLRQTCRSAPVSIANDSSNETQRGSVQSEGLVLDDRLVTPTGDLRQVCLGETDLRETDLLLTVAQVVALQERFGSNVREIEYYLYQRFQSCALKGEPWLPAD